MGPFLASPAKSLPDEIDQFFQKAGDEGVILVSFGTVVGALSDSSLKIMAETFSKLPQKIIWKLKPNGMVVGKIVWLLDPLVILLTVCHWLLMMLVPGIWY